MVTVTIAQSKVCMGLQTPEFVKNASAVRPAIRSKGGENAQYK
jgi:hypothetical protein